MASSDNRAERPPVSQPLTGADSFWLRMDHPTNLMMINGVMLFDEPVDFARLESVIRERVASIGRFRSRVVIPARGGPCWEPAPTFDIARHVVRARLPEPGDETALRDLVSQKMSEPLDFERPLWQFHLVENYGSGSALIGRFHHCMGDGMGLMMVLLAMTDLEPGAVATEDNPFVALFRSSRPDLDATRRRIDEIMPEGLKLLLNPGDALRALSGWQRVAASTVALARLTFRSSDSKTCFNATLGVAKRAAWSEAVDIERVAAVKKTLGGSLNDVLLTAMSGALRRYLVARDGEAGCKDFRATVPVNLRPLDGVATLGNEFGLVYLSLPVEVADPVARLAELRRRMEQLKRSAESLVTLRVLSLMGRLPAAAQRLLVRLFASKATAVITNVPGPNRVLYLAGRPIRDMFFWVPRSARLSLGVSILSYAGRVRMGVASDAGLVPDPENIVSGFQQEFEALRERAEKEDRHRS